MMIAAPLAEGGDADAFESILEAPVTDDSWEFELMLNGWGPQIEITSAGGADIDIGLDDILDNLHGMFQGGLGVRKGKWSFIADVVYLDLQFDDFDRLLSEVKVRELIVTPKIGYRAFEGDWGFVDLQLGLRYTWAEVKIDGRGPMGNGFNEGVDGDIFDGLAGFTGEYNLSERWYLPFMIEAGAGDSDFIFAGDVGLGYRVNQCWDVSLTFKYVTYEFASDAPMQDQTAYGPMLRGTYKF